jgi:GNAT superfamily N-acetyltransferase/predicted transcriptional regulator
MSGFRIDRILQEDEILQLGDLLVPKLKDNYPNFEIWLEKAQKEISEGIRIAIGVWKEKLIATSIVKLTASKTAELKSFFIDPDFRNQGYGNSLYEETERECRKAGVTRIITDTFTDNTSMVEFLISKGFLFAGKEDLYGNGRYSYILSKFLSPEYLGDPYDWEEMGEWYLRTKLNAVKIKDHPLVNARRFDRHMRIIVGNYPLEVLVEIKDQKVDLDMVEILHKNCTESTYHLAVFLAREFTERATKYAKSHGVIIFDSKDIASILGRKPPQFREGPVNGMVVSIKQEYLKRILKKRPPYYYIKGGLIGKYLKKGDIIVFYSVEPEKNVTTLGIVESIILGAPREIWKSVGQKTVFSPEEFFRFASIKENILAIELSKVWEIPPIEGNDLDIIIPKKDRSGSYIDEKTINRILCKK